MKTCNKKHPQFVAELTAKDARAEILTLRQKLAEAEERNRKLQAVVAKLGRRVEGRGK